jgi:glycosyltransferase involved in cell wall biosynthesis
MEIYTKKMEKGITYSIIVPVYNSSNSLPELAERLRKVFEVKVKSEFEIIFVEDASPSHISWKTIQELVNRYHFVKGIQLTRNFGNQAAMMCGFSNAEGEYIITMDDDLQHLPEDIPSLIKEKEHDVVVGKFFAKKHSLFKRIASNIKGYFDYKLIGKPKSISLGPFKLFKRVIVDAMLQVKTPYPFIPALIFMVTTDVVNVNVNHAKRKYGKSNFTLGKMIRLFSNLLINNSSILLKMISYLGIAMSIFSLLFAVFIVYKKFSGGIGVPGWTTITVIIALTSGIVMFSVGVIGEYLIRIIRNVEHQQAYFVRNKITHDPE